VCGCVSVCKHVCVCVCVCVFSHTFVYFIMRWPRDSRLIIIGGCTGYSFVCVCVCVGVLG